MDNLSCILLCRSTRLGYRIATELLVDRGTVVTTEDNNGRTARGLAEGLDRAIKWLSTVKSRIFMCIKIACSRSSLGHTVACARPASITEA